MQIVLFEPEIPPNTGNVARLCAATATPLHLIKPLGFSLADRYLKRAGLDYWEHVNLQVWENFSEFMSGPGAGKRLVASSARQGTAIHQFQFAADDVLLFGPETRGLPQVILNRTPHHVRIPILDNVRSLNLSTSTGVVLYQALISSGAISALM